MDLPDRTHQCPWNCAMRVFHLYALLIPYPFPLSGLTRYRLQLSRSTRIIQTGDCQPDMPILSRSALTRLHYVVSPRDSLLFSLRLEAEVRHSLLYACTVQSSLWWATRTSIAETASFNIEYLVTWQIICISVHYRYFPLHCRTSITVLSCIQPPGAVIAYRPRSGKNVGMISPQWLP